MEPLWFQTPCIPKSSPSSLGSQRTKTAQFPQRNSRNIELTKYWKNKGLICLADCFEVTKVIPMSGMAGGIRISLIIFPVNTTEGSTTFEGFPLCSLYVLSATNSLWYKQTEKGKSGGGDSGRAFPEQYASSLSKKPWKGMTPVGSKQAGAPLGELPVGCMAPPP